MDKDKAKRLLVKIATIITGTICVLFMLMAILVLIDIIVAKDYEAISSYIILAICSCIFLLPTVKGINKLRNNKTKIQTPEAIKTDFSTRESAKMGKCKKCGKFTFKLNEIGLCNQCQIADLQNAYNMLSKKAEDLGFTEYEQTKAAVDALKIDAERLNAEITELNTIIAELNEKSNAAESKNETILKRVKTETNKLNRIKELIKSVDYSMNRYIEYSTEYAILKIPEQDLSDIEQYSPSVILKLHHMDSKELRKAFRENDKQIEALLEKYASRYTTKANKTIYQLMVIALKAELQNILYNLKYEKLDDATEKLKTVTQKYLVIASDGNQSIAGTLTKFVGQIEYLFINAIKIEYNYYVKKEQARQEQLAIREQMRQEAEERRALEAEKTKIEKEESKYNAKIEELESQLESASENEIEILKAQILKMQAQLSNVIVQKDKIINLQNGKAGNIYVISNLGSFGDKVFKIGMTRRINPQDRVNELGDASVPFKFDVHSFIFSEDAVSLESALHERLKKQRVNKVNIRKEFFYSTVDELEKIVTEIDPTAEFNRTMAAEDYRQSLSSDENYTSDFSFDFDDLDDE